MIVDYIGIRDNIREAMKIYGGNTSVAPTRDDVEQATQAFREELEIHKQLFTNYDLTPFLSENSDPVERYRALAKGAEYVFASLEELNAESKNGSQKVSFKTYTEPIKRLTALSSTTSARLWRKRSKRSSTPNLRLLTG